MAVEYLPFPKVCLASAAVLSYFFAWCFGLISEVSMGYALRNRNRPRAPGEGLSVMDRR